MIVILVLNIHLEVFYEISKIEQMHVISNVSPIHFHLASLRNVSNAIYKQEKYEHFLVRISMHILHLY